MATIPVKTSRSFARMTCSGPTGPVAMPSRSISIKKSPGRCRSPALPIALPTSRQLG